MQVLRTMVLAAWALAAAWPQPDPVVSGLDHIMVAVNDLPAAAARYRELGFALKPGQPHGNGIQNQHVKFADGTELELITAPAAVDTMTANYLAHLKGGDGPAYGGLFAADRARLAAALDTFGVTSTRSGALTTFAPGSPLRHLFFGGRNHSPTDRPEHFAHTNGAESLTGVWIATDAPDTRALLVSLGLPATRALVDLPSPLIGERFALREGEVLLFPGRSQLVPGRAIIGATLQVRSAAAARAALAAAPAAVRNAVVEHGQSIFLRPTATHGLWIELRPRR